MVELIFAPNFTDPTGSWLDGCFAGYYEFNSQPGPFLIESVDTKTDNKLSFIAFDFFNKSYYLYYVIHYYNDYVHYVIHYYYDYVYCVIQKLITRRSV